MRRAVARHLERDRAQATSTRAHILARAHPRAHATSRARIHAPALTPDATRPSLCAADQPKRPGAQGTRRAAARHLGRDRAQATTSASGGARKRLEPTITKVRLTAQRTRTRRRRPSRGGWVERRRDGNGRDEHGGCGNGGGREGDGRDDDRDGGDTAQDASACNARRRRAVSYCLTSERQACGRLASGHTAQTSRARRVACVA